jgi:uncharacterized YccA/Bax inhibitor family protein
MTDTNNNEIANALRDALAPRTTLVHHTYRHISRPMTIAGLNVVQWVIVTVALAAAAALSALLPLPSEWALSVSGSLIGVPGACLFVLFAEGEISVRAIARRVLSWRRRAALYLPAQGTPPAGYQLLERTPDPLHGAAVQSTTTTDLEDLWAS